MGEFDLIARYFTRPTARAVLGVGDDCALLQPAPGTQLAISSDMLVEGRHFFATSTRPRWATRRWPSTSATWPPAAPSRWPSRWRWRCPALMKPGWRLFRKACWRWPMRTAANWWAATPRKGRSTSASPCLAKCRAQRQKPGAAALGRQARRRRVCERHAGRRPAGAGGAARHALALPPDLLAQARQRLEQPTPRVALGQALRGIASAAIDVSDGLLGDLRHILRASKTGATLDTACY
jgi:thiamine-monophosphate kinase